jgi:hypothetical protein
MLCTVVFDDFSQVTVYLHPDAALVVRVNKGVSDQQVGGALPFGFPRVTEEMRSRLLRQGPRKGQRSHALHWVL